MTIVGRNEVGDWVQIDFGDSPAWAYAPLLTIEGDVNTLTVVAAGEVVESVYSAPMQAFRFTSGVGEPVCQEAPRDGLLVQAPTDTVVHFMINGVEVEVGSTALLLVDGNLLGVNTFDGAVSVTSAGETQTAEPGYQVVAAAGVPPAEPEPYDNEVVRTAPVDLLPEPVIIPVVVPGDSGVTTPTGWVNSGIVINAGQSFTLTASGTVNVWSDCETTIHTQDWAVNSNCSEYINGPEGGGFTHPDGVKHTIIGDDNPIANEYPAPNERLWVLLGRIGDGGDVFAVGEGGNFTAASEGTLQFRINDASYNDDNEGAFIVVVEIAEEE